jgi:hypothetical protein
LTLVRPPDDSILRRLVALNAEGAGVFGIGPASPVIQHFLPPFIDVPPTFAINYSQQRPIKGSRRLPEQIAPNPAAAFIARWDASGSAERANYTMFLPNEG